MPNSLYQAGVTSKIVTLNAWNSDGSPYTGGAFNTATISATYTRDGGTAQTITLVTAVAGTYTSSGFVHAGKGEYELGAPTAALAAGADGVRFKIDGIAGVTFEKIRVELTGTDPRSAAIPDVNLASATAGALTAAAFAANALDAVWSATTRTLSAAGVQAIWDALTSALTTVGSIGKRIADFLTGDSFVRLGAPAGASHSADVAAVLAKTPDASHYTNARGDLLANIDAAISSRLASASYTAPDNSDIVTSLADLVTLLSRVTGSVALNTDMQTLLTAVAGLPATILTTAMAESYAADGATMTIAQALYLLTGLLGDFTISGTTLTVHKKDGVTTAATYTLNDATSPTSVTRTG